MSGDRGNSSSRYTYKASSAGLAGEFHRPSQHTVPSKGLVELPATGGHVCLRVPKFKLDGLISFEEVFVEVGGSYDERHDIQTSYACAVIEGLNVAEMLTADRVVARMMVYSPVSDYGGEHTFDITGSYFENLKIAGHKIELKLATSRFHELNSYSKFSQAYKQKTTDDCLLFSKLGNLPEKQLDQLVHQYDALSEMSGMIKTWQTDTQGTARDQYSCSAASHLNLEDHTGKNSELEGYGAVICIPKFGVIRLAEMVITKDTRSLTMFRVDMCSTGHGTTTGGTTIGGGTTPLPVIDGSTPLTTPS